MYWAAETARVLVDELLRSSFVSSFAFLKAAPLYGLCIGAVRFAPSCRRRKEWEGRCELASGVESRFVADFAVSRANPPEVSRNGEGVLAEAVSRVSASLLDLSLLVFRKKTWRDVGSVKLLACRLSALTRSVLRGGRASLNDDDG